MSRHMHLIYFLEEYTNDQIEFFVPVKHVKQGNYHLTDGSLFYFRIFFTFINFTKAKIFCHIYKPQNYNLFFIKYN